ncbi:MAG TPA: putative DNA-binding domain-containing protein [Arenimonas sp.]|uniref:HvfC family RiPP maturation protein n=1 Tax=Arenimonas sp. TaxID=1872635 RepID=UPI002D8103E0|nr:putative DNA-binding domain-containing protein [Arenimonas sp.]HEU0153353.1 putative DNA-binding domain-containing protein [Arenimonas sp.]
MPAPEALRRQQFALAAHIRDPAHAAPPPGLEDRRLQVYRDLFFNSLEGLLAGNFPVIRQVLDGDRWRALVRDFYREHRCATPLFPELPREFLQYLQARGVRAGDPPWLLELAHYEWVELALDLSDAELPPHDPDGDLLAGRPLLSPLAWALAYAWPVHRISPAHQPRQAPAQPTFLLVQRGANHRVRFNELTALSFRLLQRLADEPALTGRQQLLALAAEAGAGDTDAFLAQGRAMLEQFQAAGIVPGIHAS